jgi:hypothetical protein
MKGLLRSTWSGLSSLSRRAVAEVGSRYTQQPSIPSQECVYLLPGWAVKRRHQVEAKGSDRKLSIRLSSTMLIYDSSGL